MAAGYALAKRLMDIVLAALALLVSAPIIGVAAIAIKLDSPGPVFFGHPRVGWRGRPFTVWKLRTMRDATAKGAELTVGGDPRVTRVGRFLRARKIDELPQFWNVLKGEMSLVGPRPEVAAYVRKFDQEYARILSIRPGVTDEASLAYRNEEKTLSQYDDPERAYVETVLPEKIRHNLDYLAHRSLRGDLWILTKTFWRLFRP